MNSDEMAMDRLKQAVLQVVRNQIDDNNPAETKRTYERLLQQGISEEQTLELIGMVVAEEVFGVIKDGRKYDEARFVARLRALPSIARKQKESD